MSAEPILELRNVSKRFTGIDALQDVSLQVYPGEVHCLLGDNGAGKSTLIKILSGVHQPTSGGLYLDGEPAEFGDPREPRANGIATVHQDVGMIPMMTVARNFFLGMELTKGRGLFKRIDSKRSGQIAVDALRDLGITRVNSGSQLCGSLSGGERQSVAICRALHFGARILILDEATSALGVREAAIVLRSVARAKARGCGVVFITHNAQHALSIGDRFTVLIHGQVAASFRRGEKTSAELLDLMAGGQEMAELAAELEELGVTVAGEDAS